MRTLLEIPTCAADNTKLLCSFVAGAMSTGHPAAETFQDHVSLSVLK